MNVSVSQGMLEICVKKFFQSVILLVRNMEFAQKVYFLVLIIVNVMINGMELYVELK